MFVIATLHTIVHITMGQHNSPPLPILLDSYGHIKSTFILKMFVTTLR